VTRWCCALAFCLTLVATAATAEPAADGILSGYSLTSWHDGAGRALGSVYAVVQSNDGYLWIGSDAGLLRFDGWRFFTWDDLSDVSIPGSIKSLAVAGAGGLWAGLSNPASVARVRDGQVRMLSAGLEGLDAVTALAEDADGVVWAIADWELYAWQSGRWRKADLPWPSRPGQVRHVFADRTGTLWVGTRWGVFEQRDSGFRLVSPEHVWGIGQDPKGDIWTTDVAAGFRRLASQTPPRHPLEGAGHRLLYDRHGVLWVGTFGDGLWRAQAKGDGFSIQRAALRTGLSSDSVLSIMEDRDGNVWTGTTVGLHRLTRRALTPLEGAGFVLAVLADQGGPLAGTTKGLARLTPAADSWRSTHVGVETPEIRTLYRDAGGTLWAGAADGLWRLVGGRLVHQPLPSRSNMLVLSIAPAAGGGLWLGDGRWVYRWKGPEMSPLVLPPEAGFTTIALARMDRSRRLWLGSGTALGFIDASESFHRLGSTEGLAPGGAVLHDVIEDDDGTVWLATSKGLSRFSGNTLTTIGRAQGLPGDRVWSLVQDARGRLWLSLDRGVVRLERQEATLAMADPLRRVRYQMFDPMDGLAGAPLGSISSTRERNGRLWFVRGGGVTAVDPAGLPERTAPLTVRIEEAIANGQRMGLGPRTLPAGTRRLELSFSSLTLAGQNRPRFRYRLDGVDTDWIDAGPRRTVFYTNLSPRAYRFRLEAHPEDGTWTTASAEWAFAIQPAFYQTPLFFALCALSIVAATVLGWRFRLRLVKQQFSLALAERARLSREIHDTLLQSLVGVALQFDGIANALGPASVTARDQLTRVRRQVEAYIREARQSIWDLRSPVLEVQDLVSALRGFAKEAIGDKTTRLTTSVSGKDAPRPPNVDNQLLRIGQEAITNAIRHSGARRIHLDLAFGAEFVTLRVSDDGNGFADGTDVPGDHHYGLATMRERAEELDGTLTITSIVGSGTTIEAIVPLSGEIRHRLPEAI